MKDSVVKLFGKQKKDIDRGRCLEAPYIGLRTYVTKTSLLRAQAEYNGMVMEASINSKRKYKSAGGG